MGEVIQYRSYAIRAVSIPAPNEQERLAFYISASDNEDNLFPGLSFGSVKDAERKIDGIARS